MTGKKEITGWLGSIQAMSEYAGVSRRTISRWISDGSLRVRHLSSRKVICRPRDIDKALGSIADAYEAGVEE